jgi:hypothetical protein
MGFRLGQKAKKVLSVGAKIGAGLAAGYVGQKVSNAGEEASMSAFNEAEDQKQRARYEEVRQEGGGIIPAPPPVVRSSGYSGVVVPHHTPVPPRAPKPSGSSGYSGVVVPPTHAQHGVPWARTDAGRAEYLGQQQGGRSWFGV